MDESDGAALNAASGREARDLYDRRYPTGIAGTSPARSDAAISLDQASDAADRLLREFIVALQSFDTETLLAIADYRDTILEGGWMQALIREYVSVWR